MWWFTVFVFVQTAVSFAITPLPISSEVQLATITPTLSASTSFVEALAQVTTTPKITPEQSQVPISALVTIAPLSVNPLERRQKCWDDRGFSVDCATWTGYYYTWGAPGDPYAGGPGEGGGGSGGSNGGGAGTVVVYQNRSSRLDLTNWSAIFGMICLVMLLFI